MTPPAPAAGMDRIFPGLRPFEEQDAQLFFGRDDQVDGLLRRLDNSRFLAIVGLSGSGKSSLVRAGLLPALRRGHLSGAGARWRIAVMRPGSDPLAALAQALDDTLGRLEDRAEFLRAGSLGLLDTTRDGRGPDENLLLVVDQFEEVFRFKRERGAAPADAARFVRLLLAAVQEYEARYRIYVVITMRSDYLGEAALFSGLPEALNESQYLVPRMTREQLREAIEGPAALGGVEVKPELVDQLLERAGTDPDELPVLQHLLMRMWEVRQTLSGASRMGGAQLEKVGGWDNALTLHAEAMYEGLGSSERKILAKRVFQRLTEKGESSRESRRPTPLRELAAVAGVGEDPVAAVVEHFRQEGCNFLTSPDRALTGDSLIDISHESLIRGWGKLRAWADEEAESGEWYRRLEDASRQFDRGKGGRLVDPALSSALQARETGRWNADWAARYATVQEGSGAAVKVEASGYDRVMAFLDGSERAQKRRRAWLWVMAASGVAATWFVGLRLAENRHGELLAQLGASGSESDPLARALLLPTLVDGAGEWSVRDYQAAAAVAIPRAVLRAPREDGALIATSFIHDGAAQVAALSENGVLRLWSSDGLGDSRSFAIGQRLNASPKQSAAVTTACFSDDGELVAAGLVDGSIWVGRNRERAQVVSIAGRGPDVKVTALALSRDGRRIAAGFNDYAVRMWRLPPPGSGPIRLEADSGTVLGVGDWQHKGPISGVAFHPVVSQLATAALDETVRIWNLEYPSKAIRTLESRPKPRGVVYSPDGASLLVAYADLARVWPSDRPAAPRVLRSEATLQKEVVLTGAWFSGSGSKVVTARSDGIVQIWDITARLPVEEAEGPDASRQQPQPLAPLTLTGHYRTVRAAAFSADSKQVVTASEDGTARVWSSTSQEPRFLGRHERRVESVAFSPDGRMVVSASDDGTAKLWAVGIGAADDTTASAAALSTPKPVGVFTHRDWVRGAAFSPDGQQVATASEDGRWAVWRSSDDGSEGPQIARDNSDKMLSVVFDPTGKRIITTGQGGTAKIWSLESPGSPAVVLKIPDTWVWSAAFSPDGSKIVTASSDGTARIFQAADGIEIATLGAHKGRVRSAAFSPNGAQIVTASEDGIARIWREQGGVWSTTVEAWHRDEVNRAAFAPDGLRFVTASSDGTARIWDTRTGGEYLALAHGAPVHAVAFSPDGNQLVTGSADGRVRLWRVTLSGLVQYLNESTTACLSPELRARHLGESERAARAAYEECEASHGRRPIP